MAEAMVEAIVVMILEKLTQLVREEISSIIGGCGVGELESLRSELKEIQRLLETPKQKLLLFNWEDAEESIYEADDLVDEIEYECVKLQQHQQQLGRRKNIGGVEEDWGFVIGRFLENLLAPFWPRSKIPEEMACLTQRIRLVNARLRAAAADEEQKSVESCGIEEDLLVAEDDLDDDDFVVDREDARNELISRLLDDDGKPEGLRIVIIYGIGGIGKTTLAKELVSKDDSVRCHFDCIAWATVGKDFRTRNVLEQLMLQHLCRTRDEMIPFSDLDLAQKLYEFLQHKKYLIVLDDVWSTDAWDCLRIAFPPRETSASRVLLTTRDNLVAEKIASSASNNSGFVHRMRPLNQDESWEILRKMTFRRAHSPPGKAFQGLLDIGKDIAKCCHGVPLAIRVVGGLLASKPTLHNWKMVHQSMLNSQTDDQGSRDTAKVNRILALSYDLLPHHLKPCFLYMGTFPEGAEIEAERLYLLWLAEGFISSGHGSSQVSMMDIAEQYLNELVIRSMVSVCKEEFSTFGRVKSCHVHKLLRDFCLLKAKEQNFADSIKFRRANDKELGSFSPFSTDRLHRLALAFEDGCVVPYNWNTDKQVRSFLSTRLLSDAKDLSRLRGLYLSGFNYKALRSPLVTGEIFPRQLLSLRYLPHVLSDLSSFKRLRVLLFSGFNFDVTMLPTGIEKLFRLRYLSFRDSNITRVPSAIGNLLNLETLDFGEGSRMRMIIPNELEKLGRLRYLYLPRTFEVDKHDKLQLDGLTKLETLVNFDSRLCRVKDLRKLTKLQKLVATMEGNFENLVEVINCINTSLNCLYFSSLVVRTYYLGNHFVIHKLFGCLKLHVLQIEGRIGKLPLGISQSLTKISLSGSELDEDPMEKLGKLPNLRVLVLRNNAFLGKHMTCSATGMRQLRHLSLSNLQNLESLTVKKEGMPKLSKLVLEGCQNLKKLPEGMSFLTNLQGLTVSRMPPPFIDQLNKMREDFFNFKHAPVVWIN